MPHNLKERTMFQTSQAVKITGEHADAGRAGSVRQDVRAVGDGDDAQQLVSVQLDGDDTPRDFPVANVAPL